MSTQQQTELKARLRRVERLMDSAARVRDRAAGAKREKWQAVFTACIRELLSLNRKLQAAGA